MLGFDPGLGSGEDGTLSQEGKKVQEEWSGIQRVHRGVSAQMTQQMGTLEPRRGHTAELASPTMMAEMKGLMGRRL